MVTSVLHLSHVFTRSWLTDHSIDKILSYQWTDIVMKWLTTCLSISPYTEYHWYEHLYDRQAVQISAGIQSVAKVWKLNHWLSICSLDGFQANATELVCSFHRQSSQNPFPHLEGCFGYMMIIPYFIKQSTLDRCLVDIMLAALTSHIFWCPLCSMGERSVPLILQSANT